VSLLDSGLCKNPKDGENGERRRKTAKDGEKQRKTAKIGAKNGERRYRPSLVVKNTAI